MEGEFSFRQNRLRSVSVYIDPVSAGKADAVVSSVDGVLRVAYQPAGREDSKEVPGAYTLHYMSAGGRRSLWVNTTDRQKPIIILTAVDPSLETERRDRTQSRQQNAFGRR